MPSGLVALLDDVAGLTRLAAASLDDVGGAAARAGGKALGVVVDDTAVTPRYVAGLSPQRELPIIGRIALGSLRNKLLILLPAALLLSAVAPWAVTPLLMLGGAFLCFEGAEKLVEALGGGAHHAGGSDAPAADARALEEAKVAGAIRTDLILSAEIMAIALAEVAAAPLPTRALALALVAVGITVAVYGVVAAIVKADDLGLHLAARGPAAVRAVGRGLVRGMPRVMAALSAIGTAAMLWVGGGILLHGIEALGWSGLPAAAHRVAAAAAAAAPFAGGAIAWLAGAVIAAAAGLVVGGALAFAMHLLPRRRGARPS